MFYLKIRVLDGGCGEDNIYFDYCYRLGQRRVPRRPSAIWAQVYREHLIMKVRHVYSHYAAVRMYINQTMIANHDNLNLLTSTLPTKSRYC